MVYVDERKFACESCIKGHRSSSCHHAGRPLFEIKRKGRPVSQCDKCRELRQSKRVHAKCICTPKSDLSTERVPIASNGTKSKRYMPIAPALPNGIKDLVQGPNTGSPQRAGPLLNPTRNRKSQVLSVPSSPELDSTSGLDTLAVAATMCCNTASSSTTVLYGNTGAKPGPELPPIIQDSSTSVSFSVPDFAIMPPLQAIVSLAGSGCTCGLRCACPGCTEHRGAEHALPDWKNCADGCGTCIDERTASLPSISGSQDTMTIIDRFLAHAATLPAPPRRKGIGVQLDPTDITVYPNCAWESEESAIAFGLVNLPKLECCGGSCGCPDSRCGCGNSCDGCCS